jgi:hypothetical protein
MQPYEPQPKRLTDRCGFAASDPFTNYSAAAATFSGSRASARRSGAVHPISNPSPAVSTGRTVFGVHSEVAGHYGVTPDASPPHATTLDYVVAAAAG